MTMLIAFSSNRCCVRLFVDCYFMQIQLSTIPCAHELGAILLPYTNRTKSYQCTSFVRALKRIRESSTRRSPGRYLSPEGMPFFRRGGAAKSTSSSSSFGLYQQRARIYKHTNDYICVHCNISAGAA